MSKPYVIVPLALTSPTEKEEQDTAGLEQVRASKFLLCHKHTIVLIMRAGMDVARLTLCPTICAIPMMPGCPFGLLNPSVLHF